MGMCVYLSNCLYIFLYHTSIHKYKDRYKSILSIFPSYFHCDLMGTCVLISTCQYIFLYHTDIYTYLSIYLFAYIYISILLSLRFDGNVCVVKHFHFCIIHIYIYRYVSIYLYLYCHLTSIAI